MMPTDPMSGGTWAAVNDAGLALTLLNVNVRSPWEPTETMSRGLIIPQLTDCVAAGEAAERASRLDPAAYQPFRLVIVDAGQVYEVRSADPRCLAVTALGPPGDPACPAARAGGSLSRSSQRPSPVKPPGASGGRCDASPSSRERPAGQLFCSSGLGDDVADRPRRRLWRAMMRTAGPDERMSMQERFHQHRWADRPELSVSMRRPDARTVSYTLIEVTRGEVSMRYQPGPPDAPEGPAVERRLARHGEADAVEARRRQGAGR